MEKIEAKYNARILVIDDHLSSRHITKELLELLGCHVDAVEGGAEALQACAQNNYDMVFTDLSMPKIDGFEAAKRIRECYKNDIPIIGISSNILGEHDVKKCQEKGLNDGISKPIKSTDIAKMLEIYLSNPDSESPDSEDE